MPEEFENEGNGHNPELNEIVANDIADKFKGGHSDLDRNRNTISMENRQYASVLQQVLHSINEDKDYRQALATARWLSEDDWHDWCNAYSECKRYGAPVDWLVNRLIAQSAGVEAGKLKAILETISHTTYNVNSNNGFNQKKGMLSFLRRGDDGNKRSPLS
jgi:hypothetical protein